MSGINTYSGLVTTITSYLNRSDALTIANIPNFINQAEYRVAMEVESLGTVVYATGRFTAHNPVLPKPGRWRRTLAINYGSGTNSNDRNPIYQRDYDQLRLYWPDDTLTRAPEFYADYGYSNWLFAPTPDQDYPFEVAYLELPLPLSINNQTNWFTNYAPQVLLYGALLEAIPFLKNDERIPVWQAMYDRGITALKSQNHSRLLDRQSNVMSDKGPGEKI